MDTQAFLDRLDKVRQRGPDQWMACCPAHDDKKPSLGIKDAGGKILVNCLSQHCTADEIVAALGLRLSDLFSDERKPEGKPRIPKEAIDHEFAVLQIAICDVARGTPFSAQDRARVDLAFRRLEAL